ncbi:MULTISPECIES: helix-turn-helix domain-containing protein [Blautia]
MKDEYGNTYCYVDETLRQCLENQLVKKIVNFKL